MKDGRVHPAAFLLGALGLCALILLLRPAPEPSGPRARAQVVRISVEESALERYVGKYRLTIGPTVTLQREGTRLYAVLDAGTIELVATAEREFHAPDAGIRVRFNDTEPADGFTAEAEGERFVGKRIDE